MRVECEVVRVTLQYTEGIDDLEPPKRQYVITLKPRPPVTGDLSITTPFDPDLRIGQTLILDFTDDSPLTRALSRSERPPDSP